jgi:hypothetical protein
MKKIALLLFLAFVTCFGQQATAQKSIKDSALFMPLISLSYAGQLAGGDLADRFGANSNIGFHVLFKTKSNWVFGAEGTFLFSKTVQDLTILDGLKTESGNIITTDGEYASINAFERGFTSSLNVGKIFPIFGPNPNSGLMVKAGVGMIQHKIKYEVDANNVPQLNGEYRKGYDRLTGGLLLSQFIGYQHLGNRRFINFFVGFEFHQGFTKSLRSWDFDLIAADQTDRLDLLYSFRVGWTTPIYTRESREFFLN